MKEQKQNLSVFQDVIISLVQEAVGGVGGVKLVAKRGAKSGVSVEFLPSDRVDVTLFVVVSEGAVVPSLAAQVQEKVKKEIEGVTKYRVHYVNVQIESVSVQA